MGKVGKGDGPGNPNRPLFPFFERNIIKYGKKYFTRKMQFMS